MAEWAPISEAGLRDRVSQGVARMSPSQLRLWGAVRVDPQKWEQHPYGDAGGGFWVVAIVGQTVIWYNDIEDGFNRSRYSVHGQIDDYWCNRDELEVAIDFLASTLKHGADLVTMLKRPAKLTRR